MKRTLIISGIVLIAFIGLWFYKDQQVRIEKQRFKELSLSIPLLTEQMELQRLKSIDSAKKLQRIKVVRIKEIEEKDDQLKKQSEKIKLQQHEKDSIINNANERQLDSMLRSN